MKTKSIRHLAVVWLCLVSSSLIPGRAQTAATNAPTAADQEAAKLSVRRLRVLNDALHFFKVNNDQESATLISAILNSLNQPGGQAPEALNGDMERMKVRVQDLFRHGATESAAAMNHALIYSFSAMNFLGQPALPNNKTGGSPGPGGLVLYFPFDKPAADGVVHDESGAGNDGRVFGAQWVPEGKFGGAYRFCLTNFTDRIVVPNSDLLDPDAITVAAWIKAPANVGTWERIMDKDFFHGYCLSINGEKRGRLAWETGDGISGSGNGVDDDRWHHVAATFDGQTVRCYVDGVESSHPARKSGSLSKSGWDLCIGNSVVDYGWAELMAFDGLIDEVRIYNRALSKDEIQALVNATGPGADILPAPASPAGKTDPAERLKKLKALYDQGLINKDDYDKKVKEIMDSL